MNLENSHYDAFISYRHCELDKFVAKTLHRELENFKLPEKLIKEGKGNGKRRITRVFRDQEELPLTSDLAEPITNALRNSEYLIVICSKRLPESIWCRREVETFIKLHGREKVFAVLIDGRSHESIPDAILWEDREYKDTEGNIQIEHIPVEPLAADIRAKSKREMKQKLKDEILRLVAPMFDVSFDDLRQRHHERKVKRILSVSVGLSSLFLAFGAVSTAMALRIHSQAERIVMQNEQIEGQYWEAMAREEQLTAQQTDDLLTHGHRKEAIEKLLQVMPATLENPDKPYDVSAEYALNRAMFQYYNNRTYEPYEYIALEATIKYIELSPEQGKLLVCDESNCITVWDTETKKQLLELEGFNYETYASKICDYYFINENQFLYYDDKSIYLYDLTKDMVVMTYDKEFGRPRLAYNHDKSAMACAVGDCISVYEIQSGRLLYQEYVTEETSIEDSVCFAKDGKSFYYAEVPGSYYDGESNSSIVKVDTDSWSVVSRLNIDGNMINDIKEDHGTVYVTGMTFSGDYLVDPCSRIYAFDETLHSALWQVDSHWGVLNQIFLSSEQKNEIVAVESYGELVFFNAEDGTLCMNHSSGDEIVAMLATGDHHENYAAIESSGRLFVSAANINSVFEMHWVDFQSDDILCFEFGKKNCYEVSANSTEILIYTTACQDEWEAFREVSGSISDIQVNNEQDRLLLTETNSEGIKYTLLNKTTNEVIAENMVSGTGIEITFVGDQAQYFAVIASDITLFDVKDGKQVKKIPLYDGDGEILDKSYFSYKLLQNGRYLVNLNYSKVTIYDVLTGEIVFYDADMPFDYGESAAIAEDMSRYACYSEDDKAILIYDMEKKAVSAKLPVKAGMVYRVAFAPDGKAIMVEDREYRVQVYDIEKLEVIQEFEVAGAIKNITMLNDEYIVANDGVAYWVNADFEVKAMIENYLCTDISEKRFFLGRYGNVSTVPILTYEELVKGAMEELDK